MSGFNNPIIGGGGALVYPSIHSPNYAPLVSGWSINKDGTAQFSSINVLNGAINFYNAFGAVIFRMDPVNGAFFAYFDNGSAVQGSLVGIQAVKGGTDPITGHTYTAGNTINDPVFGDILTILGSSINFGLAAVFTTTGFFGSNQESNGVIGPYMELESPLQNTAGGNGRLRHRWYGDKHDGSILASERIWRELADGNVHAATLGICGAIAALLPGTAIPGTVETWHAMTPLAANYAAGAPAPRYRLVALDGGRVRLDGAVGITGAVGAGNTFFTLPAGYRPANDHFFSVPAVLSGGFNSGFLVKVQGGTGAIQNVVAGVNGNSIVLDGIEIPLD